MELHQQQGDDVNHHRRGPIRQEHALQPINRSKRYKTASPNNNNYRINLCNSTTSETRKE
jgi:hypothetical protein